jgi:hypothetical protein
MRIQRLSYIRLENFELSAIRNGQAFALWAKTYCGILLIGGCPMLDRTATFDSAFRRATGESRRSQNLPNPDMCRGTGDKLSALTARFQNALKKSVEGIIEAGRVLIEAKNELEHGQFTDWVVRELRFGSRKDGSREVDLR